MYGNVAETGKRVANPGGKRSIGKTHLGGRENSSTRSCSCGAELLQTLWHFPKRTLKSLKG